MNRRPAFRRALHQTRASPAGSSSAQVACSPRFLPAAAVRGVRLRPVMAVGGAHPFGRPLKAAFVNAGLANSWPAQGKATTEQWGRWLGIDVTWYDGGLSIDKQRKAVDDMATKTWDFVAIQAFGIDTLVDPVSQMIGRGIPVVQMDTIIAKNDPGVVTFLEPDNVAMAETVAETLFKALGGAGNVIMTQGALGHSGAQKRAAGFRARSQALSERQAPRPGHRRVGRQQDGQVVGGLSGQVPEGRRGVLPQR